MKVQDISGTGNYAVGHLINAIESVHLHPHAPYIEKYHKFAEFYSGGYGLVLVARISNS